MFTFQATRFPPLKMNLDFSQIIILIAYASLTLPCFSHASPIASAAATCRNIPGDTGWPSSNDWQDLNSTVGGRLIATVPLGSSCHDPAYNGTQCSYLDEKWDLAPIQ